jgi:lipopolysaccharide transport system permease protein
MRTVKVEAGKWSFFQGIRELREYRDLLFVLAYRDFRVRYAQTYLGFAWAVVQPVAMLIVFILVFSKAAKVDTSPIPYPLFAMAGMSAWTYFSFVLSQSGNSIIAAQGMIQKIYFPRLIIPLSKGLVGLVDFAISFVLILVLMLWFHYPPSTQIWAFPIFLFITLIAALGTGIWVSALTIRFRDLQHVIPFLVQFGLFLTPTAYPPSLAINNLPQWLGVVYYLNPMAGVVEGFRWSLLGGVAPHPYAWISFGAVFLILISGLWWFRKMERVMADIV